MAHLKKNASTIFCFKLGKNGIEMFMVDFGDQIMRIIQFSERFSQFKSDEMAVEDAAQSECTSTSKTPKNVDQEKAVVIKKRITICEVTNMLGISFGSVQSILMDNGQQKNVSNFIWAGKKYVQRQFGNHTF